jgi:hypothetical protein
MTTIDIDRTSTRTRRLPWLRRTVAVTVAAAATAVLAWVGAVHLMDVDLVVQKGDDHDTVSVVDAIVAAVAAGVLGGISRRLLARLRQGRAVWAVGAAVVLLLSLLGPAAAVTAEATLTLMALHAVVGVVVIAGFAPEHVA